MPTFYCIQSVSHRYALCKEEAPLLKLLCQALVADSVSQKAFYFHKVCTTGPGTHCARQLLKTSPQREHKIIVTPSATNSQSWVFTIPLCESFSRMILRRWRTGGEMSYLYMSITGTCWHLPNIPSAEERKRKGKTYSSFSESKKCVMRCAFPMYPNYILKGPFKRHFKKLSKDYWSHEAGYFLSK